MRSLFIDLYPHFNRNMIERYLNSEFDSYDKDLSKDFSEVALKGGVSPPNAAQFAPYEMAINLVAGTVVSVVVVSVLLGSLPYETWTAIAGTTIWCKFFASFGLSRHAHAKAAREAKAKA